MDNMSEPPVPTPPAKSFARKPFFSRKRKRNQPHSVATDKVAPPATTSQAASQALQSVKSTIRLFPIMQHQPILVDFTALGNLTLAVYNSIKSTDSATKLQFFHLYYTTHVLAFNQLMRCDQLLGIIYEDFHLVQSAVENISLPSVLADFVESIGPFRLMSGVVVLPSIGTFTRSEDWVKGRESFLSDYIRRVCFHPRTLFRRFLSDFPDERNLAEYYSESSVTSVWNIITHVLADYRQNLNRLERKYEVRPISTTLQGRAPIICAVKHEQGTIYRVQCCEEQPVEDVKRSILFQFNSGSNIEQWPEQNVRFLRPSFQSISYDYSVVLRGCEKPE